MTQIEYYALQGAVGFVLSGLAYAIGYYMHGVTHGERYKRELRQAYAQAERMRQLEEEQRLVELCRECRTPLLRNGPTLECAACEKVFTQFPRSATHRL